MTAPIDPKALPAVVPVQTASRVLGIGRNQTYDLIRADRYPVRVLEIAGRFRVSRYDLMRYLGAESPGTSQADTTSQSAGDRPLRSVRDGAAS